MKENGCAVSLPNPNPNPNPNPFYKPVVPEESDDSSVEHRCKADVFCVIYDEPEELQAMAVQPQ